jgi:uncharacterized protein (TIGR02246 family)
MSYLLFLVLLVSCAGAQNTAESRRAADLAAIEQLHRRDAAAAKTGDVAELAKLWSDDAVALPPGEPPVIGIEAIRAWLAKSQPDASQVQIVEYLMDFKEIKLLGDEAIEWGRTTVALKPRGAPMNLRASGNLMRVLKRQPDGSWKVSRSVWNVERPVPEKSAQPIPEKRDVYTSLKLYQGTWKATSQAVGGAPTSKTIANQCALIGQFFGCQQTIDGKPGALILFLPTAPEGHYHTQAVTGEGFATGRGDLLIEGDRWTYSSKAKQDGKDTFYRTTNVFSGTDRIHFERAESADGEHWVVKASGDEQRVQ